MESNIVKFCMWLSSNDIATLHWNLAVQKLITVFKISIVPWLRDSFIKIQKEDKLRRDFKLNGHKITQMINQLLRQLGEKKNFQMFALWKLHSALLEIGSIEQVGNQIQKTVKIKLTNPERRIYRLIIKLVEWQFHWRLKLQKSYFQILNQQIEYLEYLEDKKKHIERKYLVHTNYFMHSFYNYRADCFNKTKQKFLQSLIIIKVYIKPQLKNFYPNLLSLINSLIFKSTCQFQQLEALLIKTPLNKVICDQLYIESEKENLMQRDKKSDESDDLEEGKMKVGEFSYFICDAVGIKFGDSNSKNVQNTKKQPAKYKNSSEQISVLSSMPLKIQNSVRTENIELEVEKKICFARL